MFHADVEARSPWAGLQDVQQAVIHPSDGGIDCELRVPGSKSYTNRALILAAMATGTSRFTGILKSDDSYWCIQALQALGVRVDVSGDEATVYGTGGQFQLFDEGLYIGAGGTVARFLPGALASAKGGHWRVRASQRMSERPVGAVVEALNQLGADIRYVERDGFYPLEVHAQGLHGGDVNISGAVSSQFISGVLLAAPNAARSTRLHIRDGLVQPAYVQMTLDMMTTFGASWEASDDIRDITVRPSVYQGCDIPLEADASSAGYFFALAAITGGRAKVLNLRRTTRQPDIELLNVLEQMGCAVTDGDDGITVIGPAQLRGGQTFDLHEWSDQALTVAALACLADAPIRVQGIAHVRHHESDRIHVVCSELAKLGIDTTEFEDGFTIVPKQMHAASLNPHDDHRAAMAFSILGAVVPGVTVLNPGCASKTFPVFYEYLSATGVRVELS